MVLLLLLSACDIGGSPDATWTSGADITVPDGFPTLEAATVVESLLGAVAAAAGSVNVTVDSVVFRRVSPDGEFEAVHGAHRKGRMGWHESGLDAELTVRLPGLRFSAGR